MTYDENLDVIAVEVTPSAVITLAFAQHAMVELDRRDVRRGGPWLVTPTVWQRFDHPWTGPDSPQGAQLVGAIHVRHGVPSAYEMVIDRVTVTPHGVATGWTPERIADDALGHVDLRLTDCPQVSIPDSQMPSASSLVHASA